jgi:hypothetical protein
MPVIYSNEAKFQRMLALRTHFSNGSLILLTDANLQLAVFTLAAVAGAIVGPAWTLAFNNASVIASGTGTATKAWVRTSGQVPDITGLTVGDNNSSADIRLSATNIVLGQTVTLSTATITHA